MNRRKIGWLLWGLSLVILIPGLTLPLMTITGTIDRQELAQLGRDTVISSQNLAPMVKSMVNMLVDNLELSGEVTVYDKTRSILGTVADLWRSGHGLVAVLIVTFSVVVPLIKATLVLFSWRLKAPPEKQRALRLNALLSKWSMADVYVMATLVAYLAVSASAQGAGQDLLHFEARFGVGFWFFSIFCLVSILSSQLMTSQD